MLRKQIAEILGNPYYFLFATIKGVSISEDGRLVVIRDINQENIKFNKEKQRYGYAFSLFCPFKYHLFYSKVKRIEKLLKEEGYQMEVFEDEIQFRKG